MLFIGIKRFNDNTQPDKVYEWHVGTRKYWIDIEENRVVMIQADGDELIYLQSLIANLPMHKSQRAQRWIGSFAQWIFEAMKYDK